MSEHSSLLSLNLVLLSYSYTLYIFLEAILCLQPERVWGCDYLDYVKSSAHAQLFPVHQNLMTTAERPKILAVDDVPDNLFLLEVIVSEVGDYQLSCANNGLDALKMIEAEPPDLVLLDVMMPDMNGYEVTRRIRQNNTLPYIPIILLTAHAELDASEGLGIGADGFVRKPYDVDELLACIQRSLKREHALCA